MSGDVEPDELFANPRLAQVYDAVDGGRDDLDHYIAIVRELGAASILDVGCGTGTLACGLSELGFEVVGVDPAEASLAVARTKPGAERVSWLHADATRLPELQVDLATMTGNVAQVFLEDDDWLATLAGIAAAARPDGHLVFETRVPERRAWEGWTPDRTHQRLEIPGVGPLETWIELTEVALPLVSFRAYYRFEADGAALVSHSTLRFRSLDEIESSLTATGWRLLETREAPDRPGHEHVCIATRT